MKLATCAVLIGLSAIASAADPVKPADDVVQIVVAPAKPADDPVKAAAVAKVIAELQKAATDPVKLAEVKKLATETGVRMCVYKAGSHCEDAGFVQVEPVSCYYIRTIRPVPDTSNRDESKGPRFIPLQSRVEGNTRDAVCAPGGWAMKAVDK